jgi:hypothetical protein
VSKTLRDDPFIKKSTQPTVGPGSYEFWSKNIGHKIPNPTFTREPVNRSEQHDRPRWKKKRNASIRDNFEDPSDDESDDDATSNKSVPGPGSYLTDTSTFIKAKSEFASQFGSSVDRFKHPHGSNSINAFKQVVGPGSYNTLQKP